MKTDNFEVIFAVVDSGFAEDAMAVAKEQGVRGGTILNAHGVVNADAAAVSMVWSYVGEVIFNMLILVGTVKMADRVVREMMGL